MSLCLYTRKSGYLLFRTIFKIHRRNNVNHPTVRMSDLYDEMYKPSSTNPGQSTHCENENNNRINFNEAIVKKDKKRIIVKIKISDKKRNSDDTESIVYSKMLKGHYSCDSTFLHNFESEASGRTYTVQLTECANPALELEYEKNCLTEDSKELDEKDTETVSLVHNNVKISIKLRYENNENRTMDIEAERKDRSLNKKAMLKENVHVTLLEEIDTSNCISNTQETTEGIIIGNDEDNWIDTHIRENQVNSKEDIGENVELRRHYNVEKIANENSLMTSFKKEDRDKYRECYVIDINIPEESNTEDRTILVHNREEKYNINTAKITDKRPSLKKIENYEANSRTNDTIHNGTNYGAGNKAKNIMEETYNYKKSSNRKSKMPEKYETNARTIKQNKVANPSVPSLSKQGKTKDNLIVSDIVMKKYGEALTQVKERSRQRKQTRYWVSFQDKPKTTGSEKKFNRPMSLDIKHLSNNENFLPLCNKTPDSGLESTEEDSNNARSGETSQTSNKSLEYSPTMFLKQALGQEHMYLTYDSDTDISKNPHSTPLQMPYNNRTSIGSSEISTLISTTVGVDSLYSTIDKSKKKRSVHLKNSAVKRPLFSSTFTSSDPYPYESIETLHTVSKSEDLRQSISLQCEIIAQLSKALNLCRQSPRFFGSEPHLEAEKCLLFSTYKKTILEKQLNTQYEEILSQQSYATIDIENLTFTLNMANGTETSNPDQYYMCLLHSNVTLLASNIVLAERNGCITFKQSFQFNNLMSNFEIYIKIFSLTLENKKSPYCSPLKRNSSWRNGRINTKQAEKLTETSAFQLLGKSKLDASDLSKGSLYLEKVSSNGRLSDTIKVNIGNSIKIKNNLRGFLTIATNINLWNRRWCVLEGPFVKYWNYPSDEFVLAPIGMFHLSYCTSRQVIIPDKAICPRTRTVTLEIHSAKHGTQTQYFLQADNSIEFGEWKKELNSVLLSLDNWNCLKYTN